MKNNNDYLIKCLGNSSEYDLSNTTDRSLKQVKELQNNRFALYHIQEITFEEKSPRKEAFENVISATRIENVNFLYLIIGDKSGVSFYFGLVEDLDKDQPTIDVDDLGERILKPSIEGNFRGSNVKEYNSTKNSYKKDEIKANIAHMKYTSILKGVPGINEDANKDTSFQGVDRLIDVMAGDSFAVSIVAESLNDTKIKEIEKSLFSIYDKLIPLSKTTIQESTNKTTSNNHNTTSTESETNGTNSSTSNGRSKNNITSVSKTWGESVANPEGQGTKTENTSNTENTGGGSISSNEVNGDSKSTTTGSSETNGDSQSDQEGNSKSYESSKKIVQEWVKYLDEIIFKRLDYGKSKGIFNTNISLHTENPAIMLKLGNTMKALFSGTNGNKVPLTLTNITDDNEKALLRSFQIPSGKLGSCKEKEIRTVLSQYINNENNFYYANWMSSNELSLIAGLPQKEVLGLSLKEEVEFGLNPNVDSNIDEKQIKLGTIVKSGNDTSFDVSINYDDLNKHVFITGATGSGKSTTCQKMLYESKTPFLIIEPAKTEYRILKHHDEDVLIFTLGNDTLAPFRLNPLEFLPHETLTSRVDMIKASIESAFHMEAAIPQLIETSIYRCYENYGWNIANNKNSKWGDKAFDDGLFSFPTLEDVLNIIPTIADEQGFDERLKKDYIGSIKARLQSLLIGSKGLMLNTKRSIDFKELLKRKVVLELENIKSGAEKSLIMGFIMINLNQAIYESYLEDKNFKHITLIEEAHRLLTKFQPGDNPSKKQGVEVFTDMLAEVRKYGESLIIVDQIPNKLTPEVLKNTNTKIVHKIFAQDDKDAIGSTMALKDEQKEYLSSLSVGRAIVTSPNITKPVHVNIEPVHNMSTTKSDLISDDRIKKTLHKFYSLCYNKGIIPGMVILSKPPTLEEVEKFLNIANEGVLTNGWIKLINSKISYANRKVKIKELLHYLKDRSLDSDLDFVYQYLESVHYINNDEGYFKEAIPEFFNNIMNDSLDSKLLDELRNKLKI